MAVLHDAMDLEGVSSMAKVEVRRTNEGEPYEFLVTVQEGETGTHHRVTLRKVDHERLSGGRASPEALVKPFPIP